MEAVTSESSSSLVAKSGVLRVLHVFGRMERGGAEMRTLDLMRNLPQSEFQLDYCSLSGLPGALDSEIKALGGRVHLCKLGVTFPQRFRKLLHENAYDVVHAHVFHFSGFILRLAAQEHVPIRIAHLRSTRDGRNDSIRRKIQRTITKRWIDIYATNILAVSRGAMSLGWREDYKADSRCQVIYNGLDLRGFFEPIDQASVRREFSIPDQSTLCIHVGNLTREKNHNRLIAIFGSYLTYDPDAFLLLVGAGENEIDKSVKNHISQAGLEDRVIMAGRRRDVPRLLLGADIMIFPSLREGLPGAVLEACAAGVPVVASALPGVQEMAAFLPLVTCKSLAESDDAWARTAHAIAANRRDSPDRVQAPRTVSESPFGMDACVAAISAVWRGN